MNSCAFEMSREFKLPDLGEGVAEGEITKWLVSEGDEINEDQPMVEVMTDKATVQIPSPVSGKIKQILVKEGQLVKVGTSLVLFETIEASKTQAKSLEAPAASTQQIIPSAEPHHARVIATPATRKLARDLSVGLESIHGTGAGGRVTDDDVRRAAKSKTSPQIAIQPELERKRELPSTEYRRVANEERQPIQGIRRRIFEKMPKAQRTAVHVTHVDEIDFTALVSLRDALRREAEKLGVKLTYLPFIMKAVVSVLKKFQYFNASVDEEKQEIVLKRYYNIGFATDTPNGLIVPNVKSVNEKGILRIAKEIDELSSRAREGKIALEEIQGGTFTITNIGSLGGMLSTPIINIPEVAILGIHKIQKRPLVKDSQIVIRDVAYVSLTFDHRIIDGADAARFTTSLISILENPGMLLIDLEERV